MTCSDYPCLSRQLGPMSSVSLFQPQQYRVSDNVRFYIYFFCLCLSLQLQVLFLLLVLLLLFLVVSVCLFFTIIVFFWTLKHSFKPFLRAFCRSPYIFNRKYLIKITAKAFEFYLIATNFYNSSSLATGNLRSVAQKSLFYCFAFQICGYLFKCFNFLYLIEYMHPSFYFKGG